MEYICRGCGKRGFEFFELYICNHCCELFCEKCINELQLCDECECEMHKKATPVEGGGPV